MPDFTGEKGDSAVGAEAFGDEAAGRNTGHG